MTIVETLHLDVRLAARSLRGHALSSSFVVLLLALGLGASAAIVTLFDRVLLQPLPVSHPEELVLASGTGPDGNAVFGFPASFVAGAQQHARSLTSILAFSNARLSIRIDDDTEAIRGVLVSANAFEMLEARPYLGRTLRSSDDVPGDGQVAVLSHGYFTRRFGGDPGALGRTLTINGRPFVVVGVLAPDFVGLSAGIAPQEVWLPITAGGIRAVDQPLPTVRLIARLARGANYASAEAELTAIYRDVLVAGAASEPGTGSGAQHISRARVRLEPAPQGVDGMGSRIGGALRLSLGVAMVLLLVICVNIAGLLAVRGLARQRDTTIRLALGISRGRLAQQLLVENLMVCVLAGSIALAGASWGSRAILNLVAWNRNVVPLVELTLTWSTLTFIGIGSVVVAVLLAAVSGRAAAMADIVTTLRASGRTMSIGQRAMRLTRVLVATQFSAALVLVLNGLLMSDAIRSVAGAELGFDPSHVLEFGVYPATAGYAGAREQLLYREMADRIGSLPGVQAVSYSRRQLGLPAPLSACRLDALRGEPVGVFVINVGPRFFETLRIPLIAGRDFSSRDAIGSAAVAIVDHAVMTSVFDGSAVGKRLFYAGGPSSGAEVIGVAGNTRRFAMSEGRGVVTGCDIYIPVAQAPPNLLGQMEFFARTHGRPEQQIAPIRRAVADMDPNLPLVGTATTGEYVQQLYRREDGLARLSALLSGMSLLVAAVGLYGVLSFSVAARTREIGIRTALGATARAVASSVLAEALRVVSVAAVIGVIGALAAQHLLRSLVYGLDVFRVLPAAVAVVLLLMVTLFAALFPSLRAARVDPVIALRAD